MNLLDEIKSKLKKRKDRAYATAHFALELGTERDVGLIRAIEGGGLKAEVMSSQFGGDLQRLRQLGKPKFDDIKVSVGMSMSQVFYAWVAEFMVGQGTAKSGAISAADADYLERARRNFTGAIIKEVTFPALSASDKNAVQMSVALAVEEVTFTDGSGAPLVIGRGTDKQKRWTACNFHLSVDGFDDACKRASKVESFTIKQPIMEHAVGGSRTTLKVAGRIEYPNLVFTIPEADALKFFDHAEEYMLRGAPHVPGLTGHLDYMDPSGKKPLAMLTFSGAQVAGITTDKSDASSGDVKTVKVELSVEHMAFAYAG
jgi:hypothetical protein